VALKAQTTTLTTDKLSNRILGVESPVFL